MFDFVGKKRWFFMLSGTLIIIGVIFMIVAGPPLGIDFSGGTMMTVEFGEAVSEDTIKSKLSELGYSETIIQSTEDNTFLIRTKELNESDLHEVTAALEELGMAGKLSHDSVSDPIAGEKAKGAVIAVVIAAIGILLYISWAFRRLPNPFRYGTSAIIALVHDVLIVVAVFAILGNALDLEINLMFITALLTVIGYSVNDTIVVFDRIRENLARSGHQSFATVVNNSLVETLSRSLNTSLTTLIVLAALFIFVGVAIRSFILVLMVGVISGTYSSIFIASQILVVWETRKLAKASEKDGSAS